MSQFLESPLLEVPLYSHMYTCTSTVSIGAVILTSPSWAKGTSSSVISLPYAERVNTCAGLANTSETTSRTVENFSRG